MNLLEAPWQLVGIRDEPASDSRAQAGHEPPQSNDPQT